MLIMIILFLKVSHVLVERVGDARHHGHPQPDQALSCVQGLSIIMVNMVVVVVSGVVGDDDAGHHCQP